MLTTKEARRIASVLAAGFTVQVSAPGVFAQGITLPTARAVGPGRAIEQLVDLVDRSTTWYPSSATDSVGKAKYAILAIVRYRLLLSPFYQDQINRLACNPSTDSVWVMLYKDDLRNVNPALVSTLREALDEIDPRAADNAYANMYLTVAILPPAHRDGESLVAYLSRLQKTYDSVKTALAQAGAKADPTAKSTATQLEAERLQLIRSLVPDSAARHDAEQRGRYAVSALVAQRFQQAVGSPVATGSCAAGSVVQESETGLWTTLLSNHESDAHLKAELDTLGRTARLVVIRRMMGNRGGFVPVLSTEEAREFWQQQGASPLNMASIAGNASSASAFTEVASPLLHAVRLSFNSIVATGSQKSSTNQQSSSSTSSAKTLFASRSSAVAGDTSASSGSKGDPSSLTQFVNGGGQFNLGAAWPVWYEGASNSALSGMVLLAPRVGGTLSTLNTVQQDATGYFDLGAEAHVASVDNGQGSGGFAQLRYGYARGGSSFEQSLGVTGPVHYWSLAAGVMLGGKYLISGNRVIHGPPTLRSVKWQIGVTVLRSPAG